MQYRRARLQLDRIGADDDAPEPPSLTAARHEQMDDALKNKGGGPELADEEAPANPLPQGYNIDEEMGSEENAQKRPELFDENDTPMPDEHAAALHEIVDAKKVTQGQPSTVQRGSASSPSSSFPPFSQRGNIRRVLPSANTSYRQPTGASEETSSTQPPALEATLVQSVEATLLVENQPSPVYVATQVQEDGSQSDEEPLPWWEENQKYIFTGLVVLVFGLMAAVIGALVGSQPDNTSQESNTSQGGSVASTTAPYYAPTFTPSEALTTSPTTQDGCPKGQCLDPANTCMDRVNCFAHPCDVNSCNNIQNCTANFCGGCHAVCTPSVEQTSAGECTEMLSSDSYGDENFDHSSLIGGNHQIDKITKIEVFTGNYFFNTVVSKMETTYKLKDGTLKTLGNGNGGSLTGTFILDEGVYLKSIKVKLGVYMDWIQFCDTSGYCSGKLGGNIDKDASQTIYWEDAVIKSLRGHHGNVIDRIMAYGERTWNC